MKIIEFTRAMFQALLRFDLMAFIERSFRELNPEATFFPGLYLELIASKLEACRRGQCKRLIITLPPRSLKSHSVSIAFVAWILGHDPTASVICASYGQDLATKLARDCRTLMNSPFYRRLFPGTVISHEKRAADDFFTTRGGFRMSTSVGGSLTGRGADTLILDDPLKPDEALSETLRAGVNQWYDNTLLSRLNNKKTGVIIIVMQRLHQDDLVGHVLEHGDWEVLSLPAIAGEEEEHLIYSPFGRRIYDRPEGNILDPQRESDETLANIRSAVGEYNFQSQYQQCPIPIAGLIVKADWFRYYDPCDIQKRPLRIVQSWDTANKSGDLNAYSVCTTWFVYKGKDCYYYYLRDVFRKRLEYPALKRAIAEKAKEFKPNPIVIEDKGSGTQLIQDLKQDRVYFVKPYVPPPGNDKLMRLVSQTAEFEAGHIFLPRSAPWLAEYIKELTGFPGTKFSDQVDSTTQALDFMKVKKGILVWQGL